MRQKEAEQNILDNPQFTHRRKLGKIRDGKRFEQILRKSVTQLYLI